MLRVSGQSSCPCSVSGVMNCSQPRRPLGASTRWFKGWHTFAAAQISYSSTAMVLGHHRLKSRTSRTTPEGFYRGLRLSVGDHVRSPVFHGGGRDDALVAVVGHCPAVRGPGGVSGVHDDHSGVFRDHDSHVLLILSRACGMANVSSPLPRRPLDAGPVQYRVRGPLVGRE